MTPCDRCHAPIGRDWPKIRCGTRVICWQCAEAIAAMSPGTAWIQERRLALSPEPPLVHPRHERDAGVALRVRLAVALCVVLVLLAWLKALVS